MKYSLQPDVHHLDPGSKIILREFVQYVKDGDNVRLPAVVATYHAEKHLRDYGYSSLPKDETRPHVITSAGIRYDIGTDHNGSGVRFVTPEGHAHGVMWTLPVPAASDDEIIAFARAFRGEGMEFGKDMSCDHDPNAVFLVERIEGGLAIARMVCWLNDTLGEYQTGRAKVEGTDIEIHSDYAFNFLPEEIIDAFPSLIVRSGPHAFSAYEINIPLKKLPDGVETGSIVVGSGMACKYVRDVLRTTVFTPRIAGKIDDAGLEKWLPYPDFDETTMKGRSGVDLAWHSRPVVPLAAVQDHLVEIERAKAALLPDEALVLVFPPEEGIGNTYSAPNIVLLGTRGAVFFEDVGTFRDDISYSAPEEGGLWMFCDAGYHGEDGLDGAWRPATDEDLVTFGYTRDQVIVEAADSYEEGDEWTTALEDGSFTEKMMELADTTHAREQQRLEAFRLKLST